MLLTLLLLPLAYAVAIVALWTTRRRDALALSAAVFAATICTGWWAISRSRSSTAGIGVIFLPALAAFAGGLVLAYGASRRTPNSALRALGIVALLAALTPAVTELVRGRRLIAHNAQADADQVRRDEALVHHRARLDTLLSSAGVRGADTLAALLRAQANDREFVLAALERDVVSTGALDTLARSSDLGIALQAVRNPRSTSATLEWAYRSSQYPMYFYQALAAHTNTPPGILHELHRIRPAPISGLDIWFAGNPSAPVDLLRDVARTSESIDAVRTLLRHPALDCAMIADVAGGPAVRAHPDDADIAEALAKLRSARCR